MRRLAPRLIRAYVSGVTDPGRGADDQPGRDVIAWAPARSRLGRNPLSPTQGQHVIVERGWRRAVIVDQPHIRFGPSTPSGHFGSQRHDPAQLGSAVRRPHWALP